MGKQNRCNTYEQMNNIQNIRPHDTYFLFENTRMLPHYENSEVFNESIHSFYNNEKKGKILWKHYGKQKTQKIWSIGFKSFRT